MSISKIIIKNKDDMRILNSYNSISISLLLSYLSILIVPTIAIMLIYCTASSLMLQVQKEKIRNAIDNTTTTLDRQFEETFNVGAYICQDNKLIRLCHRDKEGRVKQIDFYELYLLSQSFPQYSLTNKIIEDVYIFLQGQEYVIKLPALVPATEMAYRSLRNLPGMTYKDSINKFVGKKYNGAFQWVKDESTGKGSIIMLQSFPYGSFGEPFGSVVITLDSDAIHGQLESLLNSDKGMVVILDNQQEIIQMVVGEECTVDVKSLTPAGDITKAIDNSKYVVFSQQLKSTGWTIVSITHKQEMVQRMGYIRYVAILLCGISIIVGLLICLYKWAKNQQVLKRYCDYCEFLRPDRGYEARSHSFWEGLRYFLDGVDNMQRRLEVKDALLKEEMVRKVLYYEYQNREEILKELESAEVHINNEENYVVVISLEDVQDDHAFSGRDRMKVGAKGFIQDRVGIPHLIYRVNSYTYAVIIMTQGQQGIEDIRSLFNSIRDELLSKHGVQSFIGISDLVKSHLQLHRAFRQASNVCDYLRYYSISAAMMEGELPDNTNYFYFPVEMEIILSKSFCRGTEQETEEIIKNLLEENFEKRRLSMSMLSHLTELVRCASIRILKESDISGVGVYVDDIEKAGTVEKIFQVVIKAKKTLEGQCKEREQQENIRLREDIARYIEQKYEDADFSLVMLAEHFCMPESRAYKEVKNCLGMTFSDYLENTRIKTACELLRDGETIKNVAQMVGYTSDNSFRRAFKRVMGIAPSSLK